MIQITPNQAVAQSGPTAKKGHLAGFTLLELLVVVLIIAILAAIALPQYQKAADKARFMRIVTAANKLAEAQRLYYLEHGEYTTNKEDLDILVSTLTSNKSEFFRLGNFCNLNYGNKEVPTTLGCELQKPFTFYGINYKTGQKFCYSYQKDDYAADHLCSGLFGGEGAPGCNNTCHSWSKR